jgi:sec-independent protein translocase protein TatA
MRGASCLRQGNGDSRILWRLAAAGVALLNTEQQRSVQEKMMGISPVHLLIFLVIVVLIFGTKKLGNIGSDLGKAIKGFKDGVKGDEDKPAAPAAPSQVADKTTIDVAAKEQSKH